MNVIDLVILILLGLAVIKGICDGFIKQVGGIIGLFLGIFLASRFSTMLATWMHQWVNASESIVKAISFLLIVIGVCIGMALLGKLLERIFRIIMLGWINRTLGGIVSAFTMVLLIGVLLSLAEYVNTHWFVLIPEEKLAESEGVRIITSFTQKLFPYLKSFFH